MLCRLIHTPYELNFRVERDHTVLCTKELSGKELKKFRKVRRIERSPHAGTCAHAGSRGIDPNCGRPNHVSVHSAMSPACKGGPPPGALALMPSQTMTRPSCACIR